MVDTLTGKVVASQRLAASSFWSEHDFRVTLPTADTHPYRLFFYADGPGPRGPVTPHPS